VTIAFEGNYCEQLIICYHCSICLLQIFSLDSVNEILLLARREHFNAHADENAEPINVEHLHDHQEAELEIDDRLELRHVLRESHEKEGLVDPEWKHNEACVAPHH